MNVLKYTTRPWATAIVIVSLALAAHMASAQVTIDWVTVGDPGNTADITGYGGVDYEYRIGKYDVTVGQYAAFLNAVASTDAFGLYNVSMATDQNVAGISQSGATGNYVYSAIGPFGAVQIPQATAANRPVTYVSWFDAARFANWMANGQPLGPPGPTTTEDGAYAISGTAIAPARNAINPNTGLPPTYWIPSENEWYKAAYFSPLLNSGLGGYYAFATQSDAQPGNVVGSGSNQANCISDTGWPITQASYEPTQNYLTDVGVFTASASHYGTYDQSGGVSQWNDLSGASGPTRGFRNGGWLKPASWQSSSYREQLGPTEEWGFIGFRLASPVPVPEPATCVTALAGLACGGYSMWRRRRRA
jgi:sulfatase modifying factor 1